METIKKWIKDNARPLEVSILNYHFNDGHIEDIISELKKYQNKDGGFGHGLEPDFRNPESTPMASIYAGDILYRLNLQADHPMIVELVNYFLNTPYKNGWMYFTSIPSNNDYPHAPWWHYKKEDYISAYNPTAAIIGFLYRYLDEEHPMFSEVEKAVDQAVKYLIQEEVTEMHELRCFNDMYEYVCEGIDCFNLKRRLLELNNLVIEKDSENWLNSYSAKPTQVIVSLNTPGVQDMMPLIKEELRLTYENREKDGGFFVPWSWGQYEKVFKKARKEWQGILALHFLLKIKYFKIDI
jgi:hypothetical protein